jgi:hypothetical protein
VNATDDGNANAAVYGVSVSIGFGRQRRDRQRRD